MRFTYGLVHKYRAWKQLEHLRRAFTVGSACIEIMCSSGIGASGLDQRLLIAKGSCASHEDFGSPAVAISLGLTKDTPLTQSFPKHVISVCFL
jgi:hypothetical protein